MPLALEIRRIFRSWYVSTLTSHKDLCDLALWCLTSVPSATNPLSFRFQSCELLEGPRFSQAILSLIFPPILSACLTLRLKFTRNAGPHHHLKPFLDSFRIKVSAFPLYGYCTQKAFQVTGVPLTLAFSSRYFLCLHCELLEGSDLVLFNFYIPVPNHFLLQK